MKRKSNRVKSVTLPTIGGEPAENRKDQEIKPRPRGVYVPPAQHSSTHAGKRRPFCGRVRAFFRPLFRCRKWNKVNAVSKETGIPSTSTVTKSMSKTEATTAKASDCAVTAEDMPHSSTVSAPPTLNSSTPGGKHRLFRGRVRAAIRPLFRCRKGNKADTDPQDIYCIQSADTGGSRPAIIMNSNTTPTDKTEAATITTNVDAPDNDVKATSSLESVYLTAESTTQNPDTTGSKSDTDGCSKSTKNDSAKSAHSDSEFQEAAETLTGRSTITSESERTSLDETPSSSDTMYISADSWTEIPTTTDNVPNTERGIHSTTGIIHNVVTPESLTFHQYLGNGAFGTVFLASHPDSEEYLAVKIVMKSLVFAETVRMERQVLEEVGCNRFCMHVFCTFQTKDYLFYVMEYLNGGDLQQFIDTRSPLEMATIRFISAEVLCGLQFIHSRGISHGDIKPSNILLDSAGHIKLADFGFATKDEFASQALSICQDLSKFRSLEVLSNMPNYHKDYMSYGSVVNEMALGGYPYGYFDIDPQIMDLIVNCEPQDEPPYLVKNLRECPFFRSINWAELEAGDTCPPYFMKNPSIGRLQVITMEEYMQDTQGPGSLNTEEWLAANFDFISDRWRNIQNASL